MRYRATVYAVDYPGGILWEWNATDRNAATADVRKWIAEEFSGETVFELEAVAR